MERRQLGTSDLEVTPIGFGAWGIGGGGWWGGYGDQSDDESLTALRRALDLGINWVDTAPVYGKGHSEELIGRFLRGLDEPPLVFTKCGLSWDERDEVVVDLRPQTIRREVEDSLRRLGVDVIDLMQVHWPEEPNDDTGDLEECWSVLAELQRSGVIRHLGVSNFDVGQLDRVRAIAPVVSLQPPYSLLRRDVEAAILPYCRGHQIGVIAYSPMASGLLAGTMTVERAAALPPDDWRHGDSAFQEPMLSRNLAVAEVVKAVAAERGVAPGAVAIAWVLRDRSVTGAIVGFRWAGHVDDLVVATTIGLTGDELARLESGVG